MVNKNLTSWGILAGALLPALSFLVFYLLIYLIVLLTHCSPFITTKSLILLSIAPNFLAVRYFFNSKKFEYASKGVLVITVGYVFLFFVFIHGSTGLWLPGLMH